MTSHNIASAGLLGDVDVLRVELEGAVARGNEGEVGVAVQRLQRCMLTVREMGNLKMEVSSQLLDTVRAIYHVYTPATAVCDVALLSTD